MRINMELKVLLAWKTLAEHIESRERFEAMSTDDGSNVVEFAPWISEKSIEIAVDAAREIVAVETAALRAERDELIADIAAKQEKMLIMGRALQSIRDYQRKVYGDDSDFAQVRGCARTALEQVKAVDPDLTPAA